MALAGGADSAAADVLGSIAAAPPGFALPAVRDLLLQDYGLEGELSPLLGERDQNFRVTTGGGESFVLKIGNGAEDPRATDMQIRALLYLEEAGCGVPVPAIRRTLAGEPATRIAGPGGAHTLRVTSFLPGVPLAERRIDAAIAAELGASLARLGLGLAGFSHTAQTRTLLWDLQQAPRLERLAERIEDAALRHRVRDVLRDYESRVAPRLRSLRQQVIHNDGNPANVLLRDGVTGEPRIAGIIDFGDLVRAPLINDVAVAASYLRPQRAGALEFLRPFVAAYHRISPLAADELALLFDLVRTRLATTLTILWWRLSARDPDDAYRTAALRDESDAGRFLEALDGMGRGEFDRQIAAGL